MYVAVSPTATVMAIPFRGESNDSVTVTFFLLTFNKYIHTNSMSTAGWASIRSSLTFSNKSDMNSAIGHFYMWSKSKRRGRLGPTGRRVLRRKTNFAGLCHQVFFGPKCTQLSRMYGKDLLSCIRFGSSRIHLEAMRYHFLWVRFQFLCVHAC